jgi:hypothetical protein
MTEWLLAMVVSLPITGRQAPELDYQVYTVRAAKPKEAFPYRLTNPFASRVQMTNFAILCATMDWDARRRQKPGSSSIR